MINSGARVGRVGRICPRSSELLIIVELVVCLQGPRDKSRDWRKARGETPARVSPQPSSRKAWRGIEQAVGARCDSECSGLSLSGRSRCDAGSRDGFSETFGLSRRARSSLLLSFPIVSRSTQLARSPCPTIAVSLVRIGPPSSPNHSLSRPPPLRASPASRPAAVFDRKGRSAPCGQAHTTQTSSLSARRCAQSSLPLFLRSPKRA